jgi:two-component SAPR family response regulator
MSVKTDTANVATAVTAVRVRQGEEAAFTDASADEAFTLLVEQSQRDNIKVRDLARRFVAEVVGSRD